jgi:VWFA-related protein
MARSSRDAVPARLLAVLLLAALAASAAHGQQETPAAAPPDDAPRPTRISAVVTDRQGRPVRGLTARDFEVRDDDAVQRIDSVDARTAQPRRIALLLDEFHVSDADTVRVREAVARFVDDRLRPDDLVVVLKPLDSLPAIRLTSDREAILQAIRSFEGRAGNYEPRTPLEEQTVGRSPALAEKARAQIVLSAMRALASRVGGLAGRPAIVLVSEGFDVDPRAIAVRALPDLGVVQRFANRYDVPFYAIDPRAEDPEPVRDDADAVLRHIAAQTGGVFASGDVGAALAQVARDLDGGYTITYRPAHGEDGKYHGIAVRVPRRDFVVRTSAGYVSPPSAEMRRAMRAAIAPSLEAPRLQRRSPLIDVWSGLTRAGDARGRVVVTWEPGRLPIGSARSPVSRVALKATTKDGRVLFDGTLDPVRSPSGSAGLVDRAEFDAPAGSVFLDMTVLGERGEKLDEDARDVEVPALKGPGTLLLPPLFLATRSAREFREVTADRDAAPAPTRQFRRTDRLLIRVPAYEPGGEAAQVTARLLNRSGQIMRVLDPVAAAQERAVAQFDLPLAPLAPGEYFLQLTATGAAGAIEQRISFVITG